jgi:hypothetical protein
VVQVKKDGMGSPEDDENAEAAEKPQHRVQITRPFYLGVTELRVAGDWSRTG